MQERNTQYSFATITDKPVAATQTKGSVSPNELTARANILSSQLAGSSTAETLDATVARGNKLLLELKEAGSADYDRLMKEITDRQNVLLQGAAA
jgi:hypothetical protein